MLPSKAGGVDIDIVAGGSFFELGVLDASAIFDDEIIFVLFCLLGSFLGKAIGT